MTLFIYILNICTRFGTCNISKPIMHSLYNAIYSTYRVLYLCCLCDRAIPKSLSVLSDGWTITQMASNCNKSLEDSKMAFTSKWQRYKMWMDWKAASFSFVAQLNKVSHLILVKVEVILFLFSVNLPIHC